MDEASKNVSPDEPDPHLRKAGGFPSAPLFRRLLLVVGVGSVVVGLIFQRNIDSGNLRGATPEIDRVLGVVNEDGEENVGCDISCCMGLYEQNRQSKTEPSDFFQTERRRLDDTPKDCEEPSSFASSLPAWVSFLFIIFLVCLSGLFSGLTLGLMGLDKTGLEIVMEGGDPTASRAAKKIYPIRSNGNLLLCTLLLGNVAVNALLSILTAELFGGIIGFLASTIVIVIFGEIIPQAACSRYALQVGEKAVPVVRVIIFFMWPLAAPLAFCLDKLLGHELGTTYSKSEMMKLLEIHVKQGRFNAETGTAMTGALKYQDLTVKEVMTSLKNVFMLSADEKLGFETIATIFKAGYSRIPVYKISPNNIIGLLFVKDLIFIDPEDETPVQNFVQIFGRGVHVVWPDDRLGDVLRELKQGQSHMALVRDVNNSHSSQDPFYEIKGIITLEDIIEVILGADIVDETDAFVDAGHKIKVDRDVHFDWARLRLLDAKIVEQSLSPEEVKAVTAHLRMNHGNAVSLLSDKQLTNIVATTHVTELQPPDQELGTELPEDLVYQKGVASSFCTLILSGRMTVIAGDDGFRTDVSSWAVLAARSLSESSYTPDFTAFVSGGPCRCLRFSRENFVSAVDASVIERRAIERGESTQLQEDLADHKFDDLNVRMPVITGASMPVVVGAVPSAGETTSAQQGKGEDRGVRARREKLLHAFLQKKTASIRNQDASKVELAGTDSEEAKTRIVVRNDHMTDLQEKLSNGGELVPMPKHTPSLTSSSSEKRKQTGSIEFIEPSANLPSLQTDNG